MNLNVSVILVRKKPTIENGKMIINAKEVISKELKSLSLFFIVVRLMAYINVARTTAQICSQPPVKDALLPLWTKAMIPNVPITVPINCLLVNFVLKTMNPITIVKIGVKLFNIPAKLEEIPVSAKVKRRAGKKFPNIPTIKNKWKFFQDSRRILDKDIGSIIREAINIRRHPTWLDENMVVPSSENIPFFIRINELPHITESNDKSK